MSNMKQSRAPAFGDESLQAVVTRTPRRESLAYAQRAVQLRTWLVRLRKNREMSCTDIARRLGVKCQIVNGWESGTLALSVGDFVACCMALGCQPDRVLREVYGLPNYF